MDSIFLQSDGVSTNPSTVQSDPERELFNKRANLRTRERPIHPSVGFGLFGIEVLRTEDYFEGACATNYPWKTLCASSAWGNPQTDFRLCEDRSPFGGEAHIQAQQKLIAGKTGATFDTSDGHLW